MGALHKAGTSRAAGQLLIIQHSTRLTVTGGQQ